MAKQDPWEGIPEVRVRPADPVAQQAPVASVPPIRESVRRPDGSGYAVTARSYTEETPEQLRAQGYEQDADGTWFKTVGTLEVTPEAAPWAEVPEVDPQRLIEQQALQKIEEVAPDLVGGQVAFQRGAVEQLPGAKEAIAGLTSLFTDHSYSDLRDAYRAQAQYDRENNTAQRNLGGVAGFTAGLAIPVGGGARAVGQVGSRALEVGARSGAVGFANGLGRGDGSFAERLPRATTEGVIGAVAGAGIQRVGESIGARLAGIAGAPRPRTPMQARVDDFAQVGVDPSLAGVGGPLTQRTAGVLAGNVMTGGPIARASARAGEQTVAAVDDIAGRYGVAEGRDSAGRILRNSAQAGANRFRQEGGRLYEPINVLEANGTPIPLTNAQSAIQENLAVFQTPALRDWFTANATDLSDLQRVLQSSGGQATFAEARQLRSIVGRMLEDPAIFNSQSQRGLRQMYGALSDDITAGATQLGGDDAARALSRADTYYAAAKTRADDVLKQFYDVETDATAYNRLIAAANTKGNRSSWQTLRQLRDSVEPQEWSDIGAGVIRTLGRTGDDQFSSARFATEWEKMTPQARRILFGGAERAEVFRDLNALARVTRAQQQAGRFYNASESGNVAGNVAGAGAIGGGVVAAAAGNPVPLITVLGTGAVGNGLSRLLVSPGVARWAAGPARDAVRDAERLARRNADFATFWNANRDAITRAVANDNQLVPLAAAAQEEEAPQ